MNKKRAFSMMQIKAVNEDKREITGLASTIETDRDGDIIDPTGAKFNLPLPLLWQHDKNQPIGQVTDAKVTDKGIEIKATLVKIDSPSKLAARLEEAWQSIKNGLVRGLSIGFMPIEYAFIDDGGIRFTAWDWYELSVVTVPANNDANIQTIKSFYHEQTATGNGSKNKKQAAGASAQKYVVTINKIKDIKSMKLSEQIQSFEAKRAAQESAREDIMAKAAEEGRTLDLSEQESFDELTVEIKTVDSHLKRLHELENTKVQSAKPVDQAIKSSDGAAILRNGTEFIKTEPKLDKGIEFARYAKCLAAAHGNPMQALEIAKSAYKDHTRIHNVLKASVAAGTTTDPAWAGNLVEYQIFARDFIDYLRPQTIVGKFGTGNIPPLFNVPFNIRVPSQTSGGAGYWVGQGEAKPLTKFDFGIVQLGFAKVANIAVLTDELVRFSNPSADILVRNALAGAIIERIDEDFIDPKKSAVSNVSPASVTNGARSFESTGNPEKDTSLVFGEFINAKLTPTNGVWIMSAITALALSQMRLPTGQKLYPEMTMMGGTFQGLPVIVSQYAGELLVLVDAQNIYLADDGSVVIDASREASLEMESTPTGSSKRPQGAQLVSMFQTNSIAIRAERFINWQRRRDAGVVYVTNVNYGSNAGS